MSLLYALLADLLIATQAESLHHAGVDTAPRFIFSIGVVMKGQAHRNNGHSQSGNDVGGVADWAEEFAKGLECSRTEDRRSAGLSPFLLFKHTQHIFYLRINMEGIRQRFNTFDSDFSSIC